MISMISIWDWLLAAENATTVGALGLLLGLVGFPLTLVQLWRTKRAADAATEAANNARVRINSFSAMRECEQARSHSRAVNDAIAKGNWEAAVVNYQEIAVSLTQLLQSNVVFDEDVARSIEGGLKSIESNCAVIERALKTDASKLTKAKQFATLRPVDNTIAKVLFNIERITS